MCRLRVLLPAPTPPGHFFLEVQGLRPGVYYYKYIVDGTWAVDSLSPKLLDSAGNWNNVLVVQEPPQVGRRTYAAVPMLVLGWPTPCAAACTMRRCAFRGLHHMDLTARRQARRLSGLCTVRGPTQLPPGPGPPPAAPPRC